MSVTIEYPVPRVLSIAGTDPTGGAGLQADLKSIEALGGYGMAVVTALVAQNTHGVQAIEPVRSEFIAQQLDVVSDDVEIDAVKIGMLGDSDIVFCVLGWIERVQPQVIVVDPVMVATSGDRLLTTSAESAVKSLCTLATVITPNIAELAVLTGRTPAGSVNDACQQAQALADELGTVVLVKGGHLGGSMTEDALVDGSGELHRWASPRISTKNTHGTGCSLSSALATAIVRSNGDLVAAVSLVRPWLQGAIEHSDELHVGSGHGPVHHGWALKPWDNP